MVKEMDMDLRKMIWKLTDRQVNAKLSEAGIDPRPTLQAIEKLMRKRVHHAEEDHRRSDHPGEGMKQNPIYGSKAA